MADPVPGAGEGAQEQSFDKKLKRQTRRSILWTIADAGAEQIFSFLVFVLMARVLPKAELGTLAITFICLDVGKIVANAGVYQRIARAKSLTPRMLDTVFWTNIAMTALYCLALIAVAQLIAGSFNAPKLDGVLRWMTIPLMLAALGNTHMALRLREFGHRTLAVRSFFAGLIGAVAAAVLVLLGAGIWAFVVQRAVREAVATLLAWRSFDWRPRLRFDPGQAKSDLRFGGDLAGAHLVSYLTLRAQDLLIGKYRGAVDLSTYRVAWRPVEMLGPGIVSTFANVALQTFSRLQDNRPELRAAYTTLLRQCALLAIPALVGFGAAGPWLVPAVFGPNWHDSGRIAPALVPLAIPFTVNLFVIALLTSLGHARWQRHLALLDLVSTVVITALLLRFGLLWIALGYSLRAYLWLPLQLYLVRKASGIGVRDHLRAMWPALLATAVMSAAVVPTLYALGSTNLLVVGAVCLMGALIYAAAILLLLPGERRQLLGLWGKSTPSG